MITIIAALTGFISSIFPDLLRLVFDRNDKKHELEILDRQLEREAKGFSNRMEEIGAFREISEVKTLYSTYKTGIRFIDALNGSVRPVLAYGFFGLYASVKLLQYKMMKGAALSVYLDMLWTLEDQAIFAGIISFYFGQRAINKVLGK